MNYRIGLFTRIALSALILVIAGAMLWINSENKRLRERYLSERSNDLAMALEVEQARLTQRVEMLRQDALFLASTPPLFGLVRAATHAGRDPRDNTSYAVWEERLEETFGAYLLAHPDYIHVRLIGVERNGRELVRVENREGRIEVVPHEALQSKGDRDYFRQGVALTRGRVALSEFTLQQEWGRIAEPHRPVLRSVTPVFDGLGRVFGVVVVDKDVRPLLASVTAGVPEGVLAYIASQQGYYLQHPDLDKTFTFELGGAGSLTADFPTLTTLFERGSKDVQLGLHRVADGSYLAAKRVYFDTGDPSRFLVVAYRLPWHMIEEHAGGISSFGIFNALLVAVLASALLLLILRYTFAPLLRITVAAREMAAGRRVSQLEEKAGGEIGELIDALNAMITKLSDGERIRQENEFRKSIIETAHDGYWLLDVQGTVLESNRAYAEMSGYREEELVGMNVGQLEAGGGDMHMTGNLYALIESGSRLFETRHRHRDGHVYDVEVSCTFMAETRRFVVFSRDISDRKKAEAQTMRHKHVIDMAMDGFWMTDEYGFLEEVNEAYCKMSGYERQELIGMHIAELLVGELSDNVQAYIDKLTLRGYDRIEAQHRRKDGRIVDIEMAASFMLASRKMVVFSHPIGRRKEAEQALRIAAATFETQDAILITNAQAEIVRVNSAFSRITGYSAEEVLGKNPSLMRSGRHDRAFYAAMWQQLAETGSWSGEIWDKRKNGEVFPKWMTITAVKDEQGAVTQYVAIFSDFTLRKEAEDEIRNLAFYDVLTHLPNRRMLYERIQAALQSSQRQDNYGAIMFIDLDHFKVLNDTQGHEYGDLMLIEVARRISACLLEESTVARLGGDEFVVLLENLGNEPDKAMQEATRIAEAIRERLSQPYKLKEQECYSTPSIGITLYHGARDSREQLLKHADAAMYQAKNAGRNTVRFFDAGLLQDLELRARLERDLHQAVARGEMQLYYQVQVDAARRPQGVEALLRWQHPQLGFVPPASFIPIAEDSAQIQELGNWVLDQACAQLARWAGVANLSMLQLAINVSTNQFRKPDFVAQVAEALHRHGVAAGRLRLELSESLLLAEAEGVAEKMQQLKQLGVGLSMSSLGTGQSTLAQLKDLPLDQLKIDQRLVHEIGRSAGDTGMVQTLIDMAHNFQHEVIAEGVESEAQLVFLKRNEGVTYQGFLFSAPLPLEQLETLLGRLQQTATETRTAADKSA